MRGGVFLHGLGVGRRMAGCVMTVAHWLTSCVQSSCRVSQKFACMQTDGRDKPTKEVKISKSGELTE